MTKLIRLSQLHTKSEKVKVFQFHGVVAVKVSPSVRKPIKALEYLTTDTNNGCLKRARNKRDRKFRAIDDQDMTNNTVKVVI